MMDLIDLQEITKVWRFGINKTSWSRDKENDTHFIAYKLSGTSIHVYEGQTIPFKKDMLMIANQEDMYQVTRHEIAGDGRLGGCIAVHFTTREQMDLHFSVYSCADRPQIRSAFFRLLDAWDQFCSTRSTAACYACKAQFYKICGYLAELQNGEPSEKSTSIAQAKAYMERNFADSTLSVSDAADIVHLSSRRFTELFEKAYGCTPGRYLTECRMKHAAELLKQPQLTIAEISLLSGYADPSYFIRAFRREIGVPPNTYRKHQL